MQRLLGFVYLFLVLAWNKHQGNCGPELSSPESPGGSCVVSALTRAALPSASEIVTVSNGEEFLSHLYFEHQHKKLSCFLQ